MGNHSGVHQDLYPQKSQTPEIKTVELTCRLAGWGVERHGNGCPILRAVMFGAKGGKPQRCASGSVPAKEPNARNQDRRADSLTCRLADFTCAQVLAGVWSGSQPPPFIPGKDSCWIVTLRDGQCGSPFSPHGILDSFAGQGCRALFAEKENR